MDYADWATEAWAFNRELTLDSRGRPVKQPKSLVLSNCILFACIFLFQVFWYQAIFSRLNDGTKLRPIKYVDHKMILFFSSCVEFLVEDDGDFGKPHAS